MTGILFFKAARLPGLDLFATPVTVDGYTNKEGHYVAPHTSIRRKRILVAKAPKPAAAPDLFSAPVAGPVDLFSHVPAARPAPNPTPAAEAAPPPAKSTPAPHTESSARREQSSSARPPVVASPLPKSPPEPESTARSLVVAKPGPSVKSELEQFGVRPGISASARRKLNAEARALLAAKSDGEITPADKAVLAQYSGNGGCGDSLNEYYTDPDLARAVWTVLERAGFEGGRVLEPSAGTGVFLHTAPAGVTMQAVELDPTSARICRVLHGHDVQNSSFESFATQDGTQFDAVVGNPPFGPRGGFLFDDKPDIARAEHYFLDTALDKCRDGGLVAMVVPSGIMDSSNARGFREDLLRKAEFVGGSRLPNTAFKASHTDVTCDVLVFRKRPQVIAGALSTLDQDQLRDVGVWDDEFLAGRYFRGGRGEPNVHGTHGTAMRAFGEVYSVDGSMSGVPAAVAAAPLEEAGTQPAMQDILAVLGDDEAAKTRAISAGLKPAYQVAKPGDVKTVMGIRYVLQGEPPRWHRTEEELHPAVADALKIAESLDDLHSGRAAHPELVRMSVQEDLDAWVRAHGTPARNKPLAAWLAAPSMAKPDELSHEEHGRAVHAARQRAARLLGAVNDDGSYSDLVTGQERQHDAASLDTLATQYSLEHGGFLVEQLAAATGRSRLEVLDHLFASPGFAVDVDGKRWSTVDTYVSGDLWPKYDAALAAAAAPGADPAYAAKWRMQAELLESAIDPKSLEDVEITFGAGFIRPEVLTAWFQSRWNDWRAENPRSQYTGPATPQFAYSDEDAIWTAKGGDYGESKLLLASLNRTGVKKDDLPRLQRMEAEFANWVRQSDHRDAVETLYNRTYRGFRSPEYTDTPIEVPGLRTDWRINNFHWSGLRWALGAGSGIVAADVGLGKTVRGLMLARLLKTTGQAKKPVFVVPKSVMANWLQSAEDWFPGCRVLTIGETYSLNKQGQRVSKADDEATRRAKYHQLQQNDHDFVLISMPAWNDLDVSPALKNQYEGDDFWTRRAESLTGASDKQVNKAKTAHDQEMAGKRFQKKEGTIYFDELGVDSVIMDEGHAYKNLYAAKNRFGESPKFLGGSGQSKRAQDTFFKSKFIRDKHDGKGVFMLTATPTKNSPLEVYSMLSHIAPDAYERMGIRNSEQFIDRFCEFENDEILTPAGKIEEALVTAGFKNLGELREVMRKYIDRKTAEDVGLKIPRGEPVQHLVDMTADQEATYQDLRARFANSDSDADGGDHIFSIMDAMGKASLDLSLVDAGAGTAHMPKVDACVAAAIKHSADGGQIIFCDSKPVHEKIKAALVAAGVPEGEIGIINADAAKSSSDRQRVCDKFNAGTIKYVIGNTATMGEGVNLQQGTTDIHHLDLPWEPASMQQRNGRGVRQGNTKEAIRLHTYLAKKSFDGYRLQTINAKKDWQELLWNGGDRVENLAREARPDRSAMMIMMAADPEAAQAKFDADKAAAVERKRAEERGRANEAFGRLNKMRRSLVKLRGETDLKKRQDVAIVRLERKAHAAREALRDMKGFEHHDLLDSDEPVLVEPVTGHAWMTGRGLVMEGGGKGPVNWSTEPTRWMVTEVKPEENLVYARPYGVLNGHPISMDLDRMKEGVAPFEASEAHEAKLLEADAERLAGAKLEAGTMKLHELRNLPERVLRERQAVIQKAMKQSVRGYQDDRRQAYGVLDSRGEPVALSPYKATQALDDHDLILPLPEHREKAIDAYVKAGMNRDYESHYPPATRSRHGSSNPYMKVSYGRDFYDMRDNPWQHVLSDVFGPDAMTEAHTKLLAYSHNQVATAPTFAHAMRSAAHGVHVPGYGGFGTGGQSPWRRETAQALAKRARELGVLDKPLSGEIRSTRLAPRDEQVHGDLLRHGGVDYHAAPYGGAPKTVRQFLGAIAHPDDAAAVKEAA